MITRFKQYFILIMGLMSILFGSKAAIRLELAPAQIDLGSFKCGSTVVGSKIGTNETFSSCFDSSGLANFETKGIELGKRGEILEHAFITITNFSGSFLRSGKPLNLSTNTTPEQILA